MARHDPKSFEMLMQVYYDYEDAKNPFVNTREKREIMSGDMRKNTTVRRSEH